LVVLYQSPNFEYGCFPKRVRRKVVKMKKEEVKALRRNE